MIGSKVKLGNERTHESQNSRDDEENRPLIELNNSNVKGVF